MCLSFKSTVILFTDQQIRLSALYPLMCNIYHTVPYHHANLDEAYPNMAVPDLDELVKKFGFLVSAVTNLDESHPYLDEGPVIV